MSDRTRIDYADASINPLGWGCWGHGGSPEKPRRCSFCFAFRMAKRNLRDCPQCRAFVPHWHPEELDKLVRWQKPRRIFVESMGDLFGEGVLFRAVHEVWLAMMAAKHHTYLLLTKSPGRLRLWTEATAANKCWPIEDIWPDWFWLGTSITTQADADERIPWLLKTPAAHRWISIEPIMGPLNLGYLHWLELPQLVHGDWPFGHSIKAEAGIHPAYLNRHGAVSACLVKSDAMLGIKPHEMTWRRRPDWIVIGQETGNRKGKVTPKREWIEAIVEQCKAAGVPVYLKANLASIWGEPLIHETPATP